MEAEPVRSAVLGAYVRRLIAVKAKQIVRRPGFCVSEQEDLEQELTLHVLRQANRFDPRRAGVNTFIGRVVNTHVATILRYRHRRKRAPGYTAQSLDTPAVGDATDPSALSGAVTETDLHRRTDQSGSSAHERHDNAMDVADALARLSPELRSLCRRLMGGTSSSVARDLGMSRRQVRKGIERIREHFESLGLEKF